MAKTDNISISIQSTSGNAPSVFDFEGNTVRVITDENGEPWFVASDLAKILEYQSAAQFTRLLDADEKGMQILHTLGGDQKMSVVNESGLYRAITQRRSSWVKDKHKKQFVVSFQRWVTHEVLPAIRKTGMYATPDTVDRILDNPDVMIGILQRYKEAKEENTRQAAQLEAQKPKVEAYDDFMDSTGLLLVRDTVKLLSKNGVKVKEKELRQMMVAWGWAYREETTHSWRPTAYGIERGYLALVPPPPFAWHPFGRFPSGLSADHEAHPEGIRPGARETAWHRRRGHDCRPGSSAA